MRIIIPNPWGFSLPFLLLGSKQKDLVIGMQPPQGEGDARLQHVGCHPVPVLQLELPRMGTQHSLLWRRSGGSPWGSIGASPGGLCGAHGTMLGIPAPTSQLAPDEAVF